MGVAAWMAAGCERGAVELRQVRLLGLPTCRRGERYEGPVVVRLDREPGLFELHYSQSHAFEEPPATAVLSVPRRRMRGRVRVGICPRTSLGTADCNAARWIGDAPMSFDDRAAPVDLALPAASVRCVR